MRLLTPILALAATLAHTAANPIEPRATDLASCRGDNLYRSFTHTLTPAQSYCSTFIAPLTTTTTGKTTVTTTLTTTSTIPATVGPIVTPPPTTPASQPPRPTFTVDTDFYGFSRVSSACSCILTATPPTLTVTVPATTIVSTAHTITTIAAVPSGQPVCGIRGYFNRYVPFEQELFETVAQCHSYCLANDNLPQPSTCESFWFDQSGRPPYCLTYNGTAESFGFYVDYASPILFYDNACTGPF